MRTTTKNAIVAALITTGAASAQTPANLIGITRNTPLVAQHDHFNCAPLPQCPSTLPPATPLPPFVGGTAWEPQRSFAWVTNGVLLEGHDMTTCSPVCPPVPVPTSSPNAFATGLAFAESMNQLWVIDSLGAIIQCQNGCPPAPVAQCNTGLVPGANAATTGLAIDEGNGIVFYSYADFTTGLSQVFVAPITNPCQAFHVHTVTGCATATFGPVTGLGVDWCRRVLFLTNGRQSQALRYVYNPLGPSISFVLSSCCNLTFSNDQYIGLCVRPGGATSSGQPCANGICTPCPMSHSLRNDPNLGNFAFALGLDQAPAGSLAWCIIGAGPCAPLGPVLPPLCGPLLTNPVLGNIGPVPTGGVGPCSGTATFALPLPVIPSLCGAVLSSQCVGLCSSAIGFGTTMSNCLSWRLQGS